MSASGRKSTERDVELGGDLDEAIRTHIDAAIKDLHTATPGIVQAFDKTLCRAKVQPAIKRIFVEKGPVSLPQCLDVPVYFPRGGNFIQTWPVQKGDECMLAFSERAICNWLDRGGVQEPSEVRFHDYSDAFAFVGFSSKPKVVANIADDAMEIRTLDGSVVLRVDNNAVTSGDVANAEKAVKGDKLSNYLDIIATAINARAPGSVQLYSAIASDPALAYKATKAKVG